MTRAVYTAIAIAACGGAPAADPAHPTTAGSATAPAAAIGPLSGAADAQMIAIPAGRYIAGSTPEERAAAYDDFRATSGGDTARDQRWFDREESRHPATLPAFRIDVMPVTQAAYAEFVATGGAPAPAIDEAGWIAQHFQQDYTTEVARFVWHDGSPPPSRADHPVVLVTWSEATAYCAWRGRRLPTASEFEKASRGDNGLSYPWGNLFDPARLDSAVHGPRDTMAAGSFPAGASPYGVLDLAGNVFEWTSTPWQPRPGATTATMTVKGSAWDDFGGVGRGASGHGRPIGIRHAIVGFRCAADAP